MKQQLAHSLKFRRERKSAIVARLAATPLSARASRSKSRVFVGHGVTFINDRYPRAINASGQLQTEVDWNCQRTVVKQGATIGSGATLLGGITVGENAMVGAGSVITKDVPPNTTVAGNPARILHKFATKDADESTVSRS